jgi:hypothetical protein
MEVTMDANRVIYASGMVATWKRKESADGFLPRLKESLSGFAALRKAYGETLAGDGKVRGQERVTLMDQCDAIVDAGVGAIYFALADKYADEADGERQLTVQGAETVFWVKRNGLAWALRERALCGPGFDIRESLRACGDGPVTSLLMETKTYIDDGVIDQGERERMLPGLLAVVQAVLELRVQIEGCATST